MVMVQGTVTFIIGTRKRVTGTVPEGSPDGQLLAYRSRLVTRFVINVARMISEQQAANKMVSKRNRCLILRRRGDESFGFDDGVGPWRLSSGAGPNCNVLLWVLIPNGDRPMQRDYDVASLLVACEGLSSHWVPRCRCLETVDRC